MWYTEMIGEVPVYWFLMSKGPGNIYGIAVQEGTPCISGKIHTSVGTRIKSGPVLAKPPNFELDDTEDKKTIVKKIFTEWTARAHN